jgi:fermentation-respiration switch protein FrsA (DUF1100 family)
MNVGELKKILEGIPDETPVCIYDEAEDEKPNEVFMIPDAHHIKMYPYAAYQVEVAYLQHQTPYFDNDSCVFETKDVFLIR